MLRVKCFDGSYLKPLPPVYLEIFGFNQNDSCESLFNYFYRVLSILEVKDSSLLSNLYFKDGGSDVIAIQYVVVDDKFDENDFDLLSEKYLPLF